MDQVTRSRLERFLEVENYDGAVDVLDSLGSRRPLHPEELVQKGRYIQLGTGEKWSLIEAEKSFRSALEIDSEYLPAFLQLGWFFYAVEDDAKKGLAFFEKALDLLRELEKEARQGQSECLEELREAESDS